MPITSILRSSCLGAPSAVGVDDRNLVRIDVRGARDQRQRRERRVVGFIAIEVIFVGAGHDAASTGSGGRWRRAVMVSGTHPPEKAIMQRFRATCCAWPN